MYRVKKKRLLRKSNPKHVNIDIMNVIPNTIGWGCITAEG